ncbi:MAG: hypothetical protein DMF70_05700 [Acidobacteria bacterium]|nr:MAG: hypothetical protein DMF70_05700 [Acidobacteriota bacterium]
MFHIDSNHPTPLYAQLERSIRFAIATGKLGIGEQLPTVRQLAVDLRMLETRRGVGTFVIAQPEEASLGRRDREKHLRELADHFIAETGTRGFSLDDVIDHLHSRRKKR